MEKEKTRQIRDSPEDRAMQEEIRTRGLYSTFIQFLGLFTRKIREIDDYRSGFNREGGILDRLTDKDIRKMRAKFDRVARQY